MVLAAPRAFAQALPSLTKASEITTGKLPDGISYYLVTNAGTPGFADFALVQPLRSDRNGPREDLVSLPHFPGRKPYEFRASWGVGYSERGYVQHLRDATVFRFEDVPVSYSAAADSTLLLLFDLARSSEYEQAVVVSGNIDIAAISERIRILSMTVSTRKPALDSWSYSWKPQDKAEITTNTAPVGTVIVHYRSPRTERELMNTIQPVMSRILATELETILRHRLRSAFTAAGVPLADCRCRYTGSDGTAGDELFSLSVYTAPERLEEALRITAGVLSSLDDGGATLEEVSFARSVISTASARDGSASRMTNAQYLDKCIASYLYGANLASNASIGALFSGRRLDIGRERELLNRYISAMLSPQRNLHLHVCNPQKPDAGTVAQQFSEGWKAGNAAVSDIPVQEDTLKLATSRRKVKLKTNATDHFSGGRMWTFSNGVSVVFKKTADKGSFCYGLMVKGGWNEIPGINGSEPAFARDVLSTCTVAGMSGEHLADLLAMNGVSMEPSISLSDIRISGKAPRESLSLVLKTMLSITSEVGADQAAFARYKQEKAVRLVRDKFGEEGTRAVLDSIMCPGYRFATGSMPELPADGFQARLEQYLNQKSSSMRNGIIVLAGDLDEAATLKMLSQYLGNFRSGGQRTVRPRLDYPLRECWSTTTAQRNWRANGVSVSLSAMQPYGADANIKLQLACTVLEARLTDALARYGLRCTVDGVADLLPSEKVTVYVRCVPCPVSGLPAGVSPGTPLEGLAVLRSVLNGLAGRDVSPALLSRCKTNLTNRCVAGEKSTEELRDAVLLRNALGRDVKGNYKEGIKAVSAAELRKLFAALSECTCEYVVQ